MNGLREEWQDQVLVLQVDVNRKESKFFVEQYEGHFTPTFILFDAGGEAIWRSTGTLNAGEVRQLGGALLSD